MKDVGTVDASGLRSDRVKVGVAEYRVTGQPVELSTSGLGSCLGVALYDDAAGVAGLGHFMLPYRPDGADDDAAKFVDSGVEAMLAEIERAGGERTDVIAKIAGGGTLLGTAGDDPIGPQNVAAAREVFSEQGVPVVAEDVGDDYGRSVRFDAETGTVTVIGAHTDTIEL